MLVPSEEFTDTGIELIRNERMVLELYRKIDQLNNLHIAVKVLLGA
jgi:hypothetical protein